MPDAPANPLTGAAHPPAGAAHPLAGTVVRGAGRGRGLGFPTANIAPDPGTAVPPPAIYSGWLARRATGTVHRATVSIGTNPTFCDTPEIHTEVYCHDTSDDLYGERVDLWFVARIRDTERFASVDELLLAAREDVRRSEALLDSEHGRLVLAAARR
ncbi:riboflavin kinase [Kitasatospora sp. NPDC056651]|uniref:riboflavin kinase n=1 Tax=Kitasatospora sp. NPDC056651 TaxID=3345892 RepID=UPI0036C038F7